MTHTSTCEDCALTSACEERAALEVELEALRRVTDAILSLPVRPGGVVLPVSLRNALIRKIDR